MVQGKGNEYQGVERMIGFATVKLKAINPTREQVNEMLGKEDESEISYLSEDQDGKRRVRLSFWLYCEDIDKYFIHSFNLTEKVRKSRDEVKTQYVNSSCSCAWGEEESSLPVWFTNHVDKAGNPVEKRKFREALLGEEELVTFVRAWLGKIKWSSPATSVLIDTDKLFEGDCSELRKEINGKWDKKFIILTGVRTDENDISKKYQQVYGKGFLPEEFKEYIEGGFSFPANAQGQFASKVWNKFKRDATGQYGFQSYFEMTPIKVYDASKDPASSTSSKLDEVTPINSKF